jgi:hypothetical protein
MHHFIFPSQDTYVTDRPNNLDIKNYGVDELLQVGTENKVIEYISQTTDYTYVNTAFNSVGVTYFNGTFTGSIVGTTGSSYVVLSGSVTGIFTSSFDVEGFTGSVISGSQICFFGTASGIDARQQKSRQYMTQSYADHALIQFDITAISQSISSNNITSASFHLKVKICNEFELPQLYTIYVAPISESWIGGVGYASDGGDERGASWVYRDYNGGTPWVVAGGTAIPIYCTQSFQYKSADLDIDVTSIVNTWFDGLPNNGFIILSSDEFHPTGSGFLLKYFSRETNTIYSPVLDVSWDDSEFVTGSFQTGSVVISTYSGSNTTIQSGSWFNTPNGVYGNFLGSALIYETNNFVTSSEEFTGSFVQQFSGTFSGSFYGMAIAQGYYTGSGGFSASFSGSADGTSLQVTSSAIIGNNVKGYIINDVSMGSNLGTFSGSLSGVALYLYGEATGSWLDETYEAYSGFISASGISGNIVTDFIYGTANGIMTLNSFQVVLPGDLHYLYPTSPNEAPYQNILAQNPQFASNYQFLTPYNPLDELWFMWGGDEAGWSTSLPLLSPNVITCSCGISHSVQVMSGSFENGPFSGSTFIAYYENYKLIYASMTGSWNPEVLYGSNVIISLPQITYPYVTATIKGPYIYGLALGIYTTSGSYSASFAGQFITGSFAGGQFVFQLSGSATTSSYSYTSSINLSSSYLYPLDVEEQFSINLTNLQPEYKAGDIIKLNVFGRKKYPQKFFDLTDQQSQYLVPEFLPSTSYYALKDNQTDEIVVNFDSYTRISCAYPDGNYFLLDTTGLPQERYYRVLIRVEDGTISDTIDTGKIFKITR